MDMRYLLKGASLCNRASPGRRASCARSGESTYVSGHDESNKELDIMFDSNRFIVPFQLHGTALNYTTETKATGSGQQGTDGDSDKRETRRQLCCSDISVIYETLNADI